MLPDGRHAAIALSSTDYASPLESPPTMGAEHLLDLDGLRQVIKLLDRLAQPGRRHFDQWRSRRDETVPTAVASPHQTHTAGPWIKEMLL